MFYFLLVLNFEVAKVIRKVEFFRHEGQLTSLEKYLRCIDKVS